MTHRVFAIAITTLLAGCASSSSPTRQAASNPPNPPTAESDLSTPIAISRLRERAMSIVEAAARDNDAEVRTNAMEAASASPSRLSHVISAGLKDKNIAVRTVASIVAGRHRLPGTADAARPMLESNSAYTRAAAIYALTRVNEPVDPGLLASYVLNDPSPRIRAHAAFLLGELGNKTAAGLLREAARSSPGRATAAERTSLELQIAEAMVKLGDDEALQPLRAALYPSRPEDLEATAQAVQILGNLKDRGAIDQLIYLSAYKDPSGQFMPAEVRLGVAASLAKMGLRHGSFIADQYWQNTSPAIRAQAAFAYGYIGGVNSLGRLEALIGDPDHKVRIAAAAAVLTLLESGPSGSTATKTP